eukprot:250660-Rhodomonas_salina.2
MTGVSVFSRPSACGNDRLSPVLACGKVLDKDLPRTFAQLSFFHKGGPLEQQVMRWEQSERGLDERWRGSEMEGSMRGAGRRRSKEGRGA